MTNSELTTIHQTTEKILNKYTKMTKEKGTYDCNYTPRCL